MLSRVRSKYPSTLKYEYDLDIISKPASKFFGKIITLHNGKQVNYKLQLAPGIEDALYSANLADDKSHKETKDGHYFTKTIDGMEFKYSFEPYGNREHFKPNSIIIIFHPAELKKGKQHIYISYKGDETDKLFSDIVKTVVKKDIDIVKEQTKSIKSLNTTTRGSKEPISIVNKTVTPNIKRKIASYSIKVHPNNKNNFKKTLRNLHNKQKKLNEEYKKISNTIGRQI
jgi:hypothetical protein